MFYTVIKWQHYVQKDDSDDDKSDHEKCRNSSAEQCDLHRVFETLSCTSRNSSVRTNTYIKSRISCQGRTQRTEHETQCRHRCEDERSNMSLRVVQRPIQVGHENKHRHDTGHTEYRTVLRLEESLRTLPHGFHHFLHLRRSLGLNLDVSRHTISKHKSRCTNKCTCVRARV